MFNYFGSQEHKAKEKELLLGLLADSRFEEAKEMIESKPYLLKTLHPKKNYTLLHIAVLTNNIDLIDYVLDKFKKNNISLGKWDNKGLTFFHSACRRSHIDVVKHLLNRDDSKDYINMVTQSYKRCALTFISSYGRNDIVELLISKGFKVSSEGWNTPISRAVSNGQFETLKILVNKGNINLKEFNPTNLFCLCATENRFEIFKYLLDQGLAEYVNSSDHRDGKTMFNYIRGNNLLKFIDIIKDYNNRNENNKIELFSKLQSLIENNNVDEINNFNYSYTFPYFSKNYISLKQHTKKLNMLEKELDKAIAELKKLYTRGCKLSQIRIPGFDKALDNVEKQLCDIIYDLEVPSEINNFNNFLKICKDKISIINNNSPSTFSSSAKEAVIKERQTSINPVQNLPPLELQSERGLYTNLAGIKKEPETNSNNKRLVSEPKDTSVNKYIKKEPGTDKSPSRQ